MLCPSVAIIVYSIIGAEFVYRIRHQMPIVSRVEATRLAGEHEGAHPQGSTHLEKGPRLTGATAHLTRNTQILLASLSFSTLCLFIRAIYRLVEVNKLPLHRTCLILGSNFCPHSYRTDGRDMSFRLNDTSTG